MPYMLPQPVPAQTAPYVFFKDLFSREECQKIIALNEGLGEGSEGFVGGGKDEGINDPEKRRSRIWWIKWSSEHEWIFSRLAQSIVGANNKWWRFHLAGMNEPLQLTHYRSENLGHYTWHEDHGDGGNFLHRKLSCVLPLNDGYEGGDFELFHHGKPAEISIGTLIIFPSFKLHRVTPVTKGERWSLVSWVNGPAFV